MFYFVHANKGNEDFYIMPWGDAEPVSGGRPYIFSKLEDALGCVKSLGLERYDSVDIFEVVPKIVFSRSKTPNFYIIVSARDIGDEQITNLNSCVIGDSNTAIYDHSKAKKFTSRHSVTGYVREHRLKERWSYVYISNNGIIEKL